MQLNSSTAASNSRTLVVLGQGVGSCLGGLILLKFWEPKAWPFATWLLALSQSITSLCAVAAVLAQMKACLRNLAGGLLRVICFIIAGSVLGLAVLLLLGRPLSDWDSCLGLATLLSAQMGPSIWFVRLLDRQLDITGNEASLDPLSATAQADLMDSSSSMPEFSNPNTSDKVPQPGDLAEELRELQQSLDEMSIYTQMRSLPEPSQRALFPPFLGLSFCWIAAFFVILDWQEFWIQFPIPNAAGAVLGQMIGTLFALSSVPQSSKIGARISLVAKKMQ